MNNFFFYMNNWKYCISLSKVSNLAVIPSYAGVHSLHLSNGSSRYGLQARKMLARYIVSSFLWFLESHTLTSYDDPKETEARGSMSLVSLGGFALNVTGI